MAKYTQSDLENLRAALVSGATSVTIGNRTITFRSKNDLLDLIRMVEDELADLSASEYSSVVIGGFNKKGRE
jgi:hypothetical protein